MRGLGLKDVSWGLGEGGPAPGADAALNCSVPERCIKYASDWSYAATEQTTYLGLY
jgi:hypothetical protein